MKAIAFLLVSCIFLIPVNAQEPVFRQHDIEDANADAPIHCLIQDYQCMIWLGTDNGLARYDGLTLHPVSLNDTGVTFGVKSIYEDDHHRIWIGTTSGRIFYLDKDRVAREFLPEEGSPTKPITSIAQDTKGNIWFATYGEGAYVYSHERLYNIDVADGISGNDIYDMVSTLSGDIWLGTDNGISVCSFNDEVKLVKKVGIKDGLPDQIITALHTDEKGNVWIGTFEYGVVCFDMSLNTFTHAVGRKGMDEITAFTVFDQSEIWIGTLSGGVWRYSPDTGKAKRMRGLQQIKQGRITGLLADVEGNIWVTMEEGLLISGFRPFESLKLDLPEIQTIFCDSRDQVWIGTKQGLFYLEENDDINGSIRRILPRHSLNITSIVEDDFHQLWIGTIDEGLYIYNMSSGQVLHKGSIIGQGGWTIMSMAVSKKDVWLATLEGVVSYPRAFNIVASASTDFSLLSDPWQSNLHFVFQVFVDSKDRVWFASDGNGVFSIDDNKASQFKGNDSLVLKTVYSICEDKRGHLWFNTSDNGLVEFDGKSYRALGLREGLSNFNISVINTAGSGNILIAHEHGFDVLDPNRRHMMYYNESIGVKKLEPGLNASAINAKGHVYVCGRNTIFKYYASQSELSIHPRTHITDVKLFDKKIDTGVEQSFPYAKNYFTFEYVGLWYSSPAIVKYLYKLEGYDLNWKESKDNSASYSNLPPGTYNFSVKASENNFFLDEPIASYSFSIAKPFWREFWFIVLLVLTCASVLYWFIKSREERSARQSMIKRDMIESQLTALRAQINPHFLFNSFNTLITVIDENPMKPGVAVEYVEKLSDFYRSILQYREQELISLEEEWALVQNFGYLLHKRYGDDMRLHMETPPKDAFIFPMTLQMLVENAIKHNVISKTYPLDVYITIQDGYITVSNNLRPKPNPEPSTLFGLESIISRYQLLSERKVIVEKNEQAFVVHIPILKKSGL